MNITFLLSRFLDGGIDTVLVRYLQNIDTKSNNIKFIIGTEYKGLQPFEQMIPKEVEVKYLLHDNILTHIPKRKLTHKISLAQKIVDSIFLAPIRQIIKGKRLHNELKDTDVVVDFDTTYYSRLKNVKVRKVAVFHFSINKYHRGNSKKIDRLCHKMQVYDKIILICNKMKDEFIARAPQLADKLTVIYNPVSANQLQNDAAKYPAPTEDYILYVARLEEHQKDLTTLIKAYAIARQQAALPKLYVVGDGCNKQQLQELAKSEGVSEQVAFLGFKTNPMPLIANTKLFVLSSKFEGLPTVLIEALMLDRVIISTDCPTGPAEILNYGKCGKLVPIGSPTDMAAAIIEMLFDENKRNEIINNIQAHKHLFTTEYCIDKFFKELQN